MKFSANVLKTLPILILISLVISAGKAKASVCPAFGADTDCGSLITITNTGATTSVTGQGPYDGNDDTLVGVINNSSNKITSLALTSTFDIFGFDGDGIASSPYNAPANALDNTGYGGPNTYFTNINASQTAGIVNFITPIALGGTAYFSLENALPANSFTVNPVTSVPEPTPINILTVGLFLLTLTGIRRNFSRPKTFAS